MTTLAPQYLGSTAAACAPSKRERPFLVELERRPEPDRAGAARFRPSARLVLLPSLRVSGLLAAMPPEEVKALMFLLTFLSPNGHLGAALPEIAAAMQVPEGKARHRMERLITFVWEGEPVARETQPGLGLDAYTVSPHLLAVRETAPPQASADALSSKRDAVMAYSRARYARPRAEVERTVAAQLGHNPEAFGEGLEASLRRRLYILGVPAVDAEVLLSEHPPADIERQLEWLPYRNARNPGRFLVAAVRGDYEPPPGLPSSAAAAPDEPGIEPYEDAAGGEAPVEEDAPGRTNAVPPADVDIDLTLSSSAVRPDGATHGADAIKLEVPR